MSDFRHEYKIDSLDSVRHSYCFLKQTIDAKQAETRLKKALDGYKKYTQEFKSSFLTQPPKLVYIAFADFNATASSQYSAEKIVGETVDELGYHVNDIVRYYRADGSSSSNNDIYLGGFKGKEMPFGQTTQTPLPNTEIYYNNEDIQSAAKSAAFSAEYDAREGTVNTLKANTSYEGDRTSRAIARLSLKNTITHISTSSDIDTKIIFVPMYVYTATQGQYIYETFVDAASGIVFNAEQLHEELRDNKEKAKAITFSAVFCSIAALLFFVLPFVAIKYLAKVSIFWALLVIVLVGIIPLAKANSAESGWAKTISICGIVVSMFLFVLATFFTPQIEVSTAKDYNMMRNYPTANFVLTNDIDFNYKKAKSIDYFFGTLEGNSHCFKNFEMYYEDYLKRGGFFRNLIGSCSNVGWEDFDYRYTSTHSAGVVAGKIWKSGKLTNCYIRFSGQTPAYNITFYAAKCSHDVFHGTVAGECDGLIQNFTIMKAHVKYGMHENATNDYYFGGVVGKMLKNGRIEDCGEENFANLTTEDYLNDSVDHIKYDPFVAYPQQPTEQDSETDDTQ